MEIYDVKRLSLVLKISEDKVYDLPRKRQIRYSKIGNKYLVTEQSLEQFLKKTRVKK